MNSQKDEKERRIFEGKTHTGVNPLPADDRPKYHGSEKRQTVQVAGRVSPGLKAEVARLAKLRGVTESKMLASLLEQAVAGNLAEQFAVQLKNALKEAAIESMSAISKANNRAGNLALEAFYSAEEGRLLTVYLCASSSTMTSTFSLRSSKTLRNRPGRMFPWRCIPGASRTENTNKKCQL